MISAARTLAPHSSTLPSNQQVSELLVGNFAAAALFTCHFDRCRGFDPCIFRHIETQQFCLTAGTTGGQPAAPQPFVPIRQQHAFLAKTGPSAAPAQGSLVAPQGPSPPAARALQAAEHAIHKQDEASTISEDFEDAGKCYSRSSLPKQGSMLIDSWLHLHSNAAKSNVSIATQRYRAGPFLVMPQESRTMRTVLPTPCQH